MEVTLPLPVRLLNTAGSLVRGAGLPLATLDPEILMQVARKATGLDDFGDPFFREGLDRVCRSLEEEAALTLLGRITAKRDIVRLLENRLRIEDTLKRHPDILDAPLERPIFVVGLPRTGTSILHELLAQDPGNRVPWTWEVMHPWPPPHAATTHSDPRIAVVEKHYSEIDRILPEFKKMHPMGATLPQECVALTAHVFASMVYSTQYRVPCYQAWLESVDHVPVYEDHRRQLRYLQWKNPARRWVLKSPGHLWTLDALLSVYPDARLVFTHRDPITVLASLVSLVITLRQLASDRIDPLEIATEWTELLARGLDASMAARDRAQLPPDQVLDVDFRAFIGNEVDTVRGIYDHFDLEFSAGTETGIRDFLAANPKDKHGRHTYDLAATGLDPQALRERFAPYIERHLRAS